MSGLDQLQREVGEWGLRTFPDSTMDSILNHFCEEILEFVGPWRMLEAIARLPATKRVADGDDAEIPDAPLLLLHYCERAGISLDTAMREKFEACQKRTYAHDATAGYARHIEAEER